MAIAQQYKDYFEFIRYALTPNRLSISDIKVVDWRRLYNFANEQTISGVVFDGVKRLGGQGIKPSFDILMQWVATTEQIEGQNRRLNKRCVEVVNEYRNAGFQCCILKGQGNATMYTNPFCRMPGDIDLWIFGPADRAEKAEIIKYVRANHPEKMEVRYYHVGYEDNGVEVEVHFMPNIMNNPLYHHRLQKWYHKMADGGRLKDEVELPEGAGVIPVPTTEFNIVFQLAHMMHHFFDEGIGLRQFVDYYFVLMAADFTDFTDYADNKGIGDTLRYLGLWKFAGAAMYVMREVFQLDEKYMIAPVDERRGKTLMAEILKGGNFGQSDVRWKKAEGRWFTGKKYFLKHWRNLHFVREYPAEALCEPIFRTWHWFWRKFH